MGLHSTLRWELYDYLVDELDEQRRKEVEEHLRACASCRTELEELRSALAAVPRPHDHPADKLSPEFWQSFIADVERSIEEEAKPAPSAWSRFVEQFTSLPVFQPRVAIAMAVVFVLILGGVITREVLLQRSVERTATAVLQPVQQDTVPADVSTRMTGYLRRSKNLLVGLANMKPSPSGDFDFSPERRMSRELVQEARFLKQQPLDDRSAQLLSDLEKIQIELANLEESHHASEVELIRHGIERENLLFKVRVTETLYDRASFVQTRYEK